MREKKDTSQKKAELIAQAAYDKKAHDIVIMNMSNLSVVCDYFVIASAESTTKVRAIADNIEEVLGKKKYRLLHLEGYSEAHWVVLDFADAVAHIFYSPVRSFYDLERLWGDAVITRYRPRQIRRAKTKK